MLPPVEVLVGLFTLLVVLYQVKLMQRQTTVMNTQLEIMKRQAELLARRADLQVKTAAAYADNNRQVCSVSFLVENKGAKTAREFYWHILVPVRNRAGGAFALSGGGTPKTDEVQISGIPHDYYSGLYRDPLYPTREVRLGTLNVLSPQPDNPLVLGWKLISEDGKFPANQEFGQIEVLVVPLQTP